MVHTLELLRVFAYYFPQNAEFSTDNQKTLSNTIEKALSDMVQSWWSTEQITCGPDNNITIYKYKDIDSSMKDFKLLKSDDGQTISEEFRKLLKILDLYMKIEHKFNNLVNPNPPSSENNPNRRLAPILKSICNEMSLKKTVIGGTLNNFFQKYESVRNFVLSVDAFVSDKESGDNHKDSSHIHVINAPNGDDVQTLKDLLVLEDSINKENLTFVKDNSPFLFSFSDDGESIQAYIVDLLGTLIAKVDEILGDESFTEQRMNEFKEKLEMFKPLDHLMPKSVNIDGSLRMLKDAIYERYKKKYDDVIDKIEHDIFFNGDGKSIIIPFLIDHYDDREKDGNKYVEVRDKLKTKMNQYLQDLRKSISNVYQFNSELKKLFKLAKALDILIDEVVIEKKKKKSSSNSSKETGIIRGTVMNIVKSGLKVFTSSNSDDEDDSKPSSTSSMEFPPESPMSSIRPLIELVIHDMSSSFAFVKEEIQCIFEVVRLNVIENSFDEINNHKKNIFIGNNIQDLIQKHVSLKNYMEAIQMKQ